MITGFGTIAALGENLGISSVLATLTVGVAFAAVRFLIGGTGWEPAAGWVLIVSSVLATYTAGAMMIASTWGRTLLPLGEYRRAANVPGKRPLRTLEYGTSCGSWRASPRPACSRRAPYRTTAGAAGTTAPGGAHVRRWSYA